MRDSKQVKILTHMLVMSLSGMLVEYSNRRQILATAKEYGEAFVSSLDALYNRSHVRLTFAEQNTIKNLILLSVNDVLKTRTGILISEDNKGRRYRLENSLQRYILMALVNNDLKHHVERAHDNNSAVHIYNPNRPLITHKVRPRETQQETIREIKANFDIHPYTRVEFSS